MVLFLTERDGDNLKSIIRMNPDKSLQVISLVQTFQNENNADELQFLLPQTYGDIDILTCKVTLYWLNSQGQGDAIPLQFDTELYNDMYLKSIILISNKFTQVIGDLELWIEILNTESTTLLKSGVVKIPIREHKDFNEYIPEGQLSILDEINFKIQQLESGVTDIYNSIPSVDDIESLFEEYIIPENNSISNSRLENIAVIDDVNLK